jgi:hypothetical protein
MSLGDPVSNKQDFPVAPPGIRDIWQGTSTLTNLTGSFYYSPDFDMIWCSKTTTGLAYSTNGGVTFTDCKFDVAPTGFMRTGSNSTLVICMDADMNGPVYNSTDGINFTKVGSLFGVGAGIGTYTIPWDSRVGAFSSSSNTSVIISYDGTSWALEPSPIGKINNFTSNNVIFVATGNNAPYFAYSYDGYTWFATPSTVSSCIAVAWSEDQKEFLAITRTTGEGIVSTDGINWVSRGIIGPVASVEAQLMWVGDDIKRWYLGANYNGNYSMWSTYSSLVPFTTTIMTGSRYTPSGMATGIAYDSSRKRFMLGLYADAPHFVYSTPSNDLMPIADLRYKGNTVTTDQFSANPVYGPIVTNTLYRGMLLSGTGKGSLTVPSGFTGGSVLHINTNLLVSALAGSAVTVDILYGGIFGVSVLSTIISGPLTNVVFKLKADLVSDSGTNIAANGVLTSIGTSPIVFNLDTASIDPTISHNLFLTATWSVASTSNTIKCGPFIVTRDF